MKKGKYDILWGLLSLLIPPVGLILFIIFLIKKRSAYQICLIGFIIGLFVFYYFTWPWVQQMIVQQTCNTYGPGWKAQRNTELGSVVKWVCVNPDYEKINPETGEEYSGCGYGNAAKPIIYLYPEETTELTVKLGYKENITTSYPKYENGWNVIANPNGRLIDKNTNRELYSLYWEGKNSVEFSTDDGFVVKGVDTSKFLEEKLAILGLNETEAEEFIIYWLPILEENEYNYIRFASLEEINKNMPLYISKTPDSLIRVLMIFKKLDNYIEVKEEELTTPTREGFTVVEWGGTALE